MARLRVGLALGAGGTKGMAHVGVLKALHEARIPLDCIAGASIGAIFGAGYAAGRAPDEMVRGVNQTGTRHVLDFFRHGLRLDRDNPLARTFRKAFEGLTFEQLEIPFTAVAADVLEKRPVFITDGELIPALEASIAVPFVAKPVEWRGRLLVDGGFWEPAPISAAAYLGADVIISVELGDPLALPQRLRPAARWLASLFDTSRPATAAPPVEGANPPSRSRDRLMSAPFVLRAVSEAPCPPPEAHVSIRPDLRGLVGGTALNLREAMLRGEEAAWRAMPRVRALVRGETPPSSANRNGHHGSSDPKTGAGLAAGR